MNSRANTIALGIANRFPLLGRVLRRFYAEMYSALPVRHSYSQYGEDLWVAAHMPPVNDKCVAYVDVGANHPMRISNSYLLYRQGHRGVTIEPNRELIELHRRFRPRDIAIGLGCSNSPGIESLRVCSTPVLSTFNRSSDLGMARTVRREYVPVLDLDRVADVLEIENLPFLSIDTEGYDLNVLLGAKRLLERTMIVLVEYKGAGSARIDEALAEHFRKAAIFGCNCLFIHKIESV